MTARPAEDRATRGAWVEAALVVLFFLLLQYRDAALFGRHWLWGDNAFQNYPWHHFIESCRAGRDVFAPVPEMSLGYPLWVDPQVGVFYPLNTAWWPLLDSFGSFTLKFLIHLALAAAGMFALARSRRLTPLGAAAAAVVYATGSYMVHRIVHPPILQPAAWLPWAVFCFLRGMEGRGWRWLVLAAAAHGGLFYAGQPQMLLPAAGACLFLGAACQTGDLPWLRRVGRAAGCYAMVGAATLLLAAVLWIPALDAVPVGPRTGASQVEWLTMWGSTFRESLVDAVGGLPIGLKFEKTAFSSTAGLLGLLAVFLAPELRRWRGWAALAALTWYVTWTVGNPVYRLLIYVPVLNRFRGSGRYGVLFALGAAMAVGVLVDHLGSFERRRWLTWCGAIGLLVLIAAAVATTSATIPPPPGVGVQLAVLVVVAWAGLAASEPRRAAWARRAVVLAVGFELAWFGNGVNAARTPAEWRSDEENRIYAAAAELCATDDTAFVGWLERLPTNLSLLYGVRQATSHAPVALPGYETANIVFYGPNNPEVLAAYGVGWVAARRDLGVEWGLTPVRDVGEWTLFRNPVTPARVYVPRFLAPVSTAPVKELLQARDADPRIHALAPPGFGLPGYVPGRGGEAEIVSEGPREVRVRARSESTVLVVLTRSWAPGWSVTVDGRPTLAWAANLFLLAAPTPAGEHELVFRYDPDIDVEKALSAKAWLLLLLALVATTWRDRRALE